MAVSSGPTPTVPPPAYQACAITMGFAKPIVPLGPVRDKLAAGSGDQLALDSGASPDSALLLRSTSGHSQLHLRQDEATLQTFYSGAFAASDVGAASLRIDYGAEKLAAAFEVLALAGAEIALFGVTVIARISPAESETELLRSATTRAFALNPLFTEGEDAYDFVLRASRPVGADLFSNVQVSWFQERSIQVQITPAHLALGLVQFKEWDATLTGQGLELSYDRNNKQGLFAGRRSWTNQELAEVLRGTLNASGEAFSRIRTAVVQGLGAA